MLHAYQPASAHKKKKKTSRERIDRQKILAAVRTLPGLSSISIQRKVGYSYSSVIYALFQLEKQGLIYHTRKKTPGTTYYWFPVANEP